MEKQQLFAEKVDEIMNLKKDLLSQNTTFLEKELVDIVTSLYKE